MPASSGHCSDVRFAPGVFIIVSLSTAPAATTPASSTRHSTASARGSAGAHARPSAAAARASLRAVESAAAPERAASSIGAAQVAAADAVCAAAAAKAAAVADAARSVADTAGPRVTSGRSVADTAGPRVTSGRAVAGTAGACIETSCAITRPGRANSAAADVSALTLHLLAGARLPLRQRVATRRAAVLIGGGAVAIRRPAAMLGTVLPVRSPAQVAVSRADVGVAVEVVVVVDGDVVVAAPPASPAPAAASAPDRADGNADAETKRQTAGWVIDGRIGIDGRAVRPDRIVFRNVNNLRVGLLDHDDLLALDDLCLHRLLRGRRQRPFLLRFVAHSLDGVHHVVLLSEKGVAEVRGPLDIVGEALDEIRQPRHGLNTGIPGLLRHGVDQGFVLQAWILLQPLMQLEELQRIG